MASNRSQMFACLVVLGCLATLAVALPTPQEDDTGDFSESQPQPQFADSYNGPYVPHSSEGDDASSNESDGNSGEASVPVIAKRSADEAKDQPKIEPVNKAGLTRPWSSVPQSQQNTPSQNQGDKEKRSAEETKETPRATASTTTTAVPTKGSYVTRPIVPATADKKDKRETKEPIAPARLPSNTPTIPSKLNTPAAIARPVGTTAGNKKDKRSAEEATTKQPETKPWQTRTEVTTEQVKTSARPVPLPFIPSRND